MLLFDSRVARHRCMYVNVVSCKRGREGTNATNATQRAGRKDGNDDKVGGGEGGGGEEGEDGECGLKYICEYQHCRGRFLCRGHFCRPPPWAHCPPSSLPCRASSSSPAGAAATWFGHGSTPRRPCTQASLSGKGGGLARCSPGPPSAASLVDGGGGQGGVMAGRV